jgi:hypothetical protein
MSTAARFTGAKNTDNTGRAAQRDYQKLAVTAPTNLAAIPNAAHTLFDLSVAVATPTINIAVGSATTAPFVGDTAQLIITPDATTRVITWGTGFIPTATTLSATASKVSTVNLLFNGAGWLITGTSTAA